MHKRLRDHFGGATDDLLSAFRRTTSAANAVRGTTRERRALTILANHLPASCRMLSGEAIDSGGASSRLDGIVVHNTGLALATTQDEDCVVVIEGCMAVLELKSNLRTQWAQVLKTWDAVRRLKREVPSGCTGQQIQFDGAPSPTLGPRFPFFVLGRSGWKTAESLEAHSRELLSELTANDRPWLARVIQIAPEMTCTLEWTYSRLFVGTMVSHL